MQSDVAVAHVGDESHAGSVDLNGYFSEIEEEDRKDALEEQLLFGWMAHSSACSCGIGLTV